MMTIFSRSIALIFCLFPVVYQPAAANDRPHATILVLGDSLSSAYGINTDEGWVALMRKQINQQNPGYDIVNASVSGDTTRTGLSRVSSALQQHKPSVVIIALGGNDGLRGLAFSEIENSLTNIISRCKQTGARVLLVGVRLPTNYGPEYNDAFAALYRRLAEEQQVALVPQMLKQVAGNPGLLQEDGIHPKASAQKMIMDNIWTGLKPLLR